MLSNANTSQKLIKGKISYEDLDFAKENDQLIVLGQGSFGIVYKGNYSGYTVAIKELRLQLLSTDSIKEFQREIRAMKVADNPNIVGFYGSSIHNNTAYMIMEYLEGGSLRSLLNKKKIEEISWPFRLRVATDLIEGLYYLHRNRILHRDIKADNVLIAADGRAKLSDLGLACQSKHLNETLSSQSYPLSYADSGQRGTWRWMAPEILEYSDKYSDKSDIYAYGVTLWEIVSHAVPFHGDGITQIIVKVIRGVRPEQVMIPEEYSYYQSIIEDSWQQNPEMRPTAKDLKQRFLEFAASVRQEISSYKEIEEKLAAAVADREQVEQELAAAKAARMEAEQVAALLLQNLVTAGMPDIYPAPASNQFTPSYSSQTATTFTTTSSAMPEIDQQQLQQFLQLVVEGEQDQAEAMLQQNLALALHAGDVTDLSGRSFNNITGFQYAVWALDWHMWTMILHNLPEYAVQTQIKAMETGSWVTTHGVSVSWQNLIDAFTHHISLARAARWEGADEKLMRDAGNAQQLLPVHVINEYCYPGRPFDPCPGFQESVLPRTRQTDKGEWFTSTYKGKKIGMNNFIYYRVDAQNAWRWTGQPGVRCGPGPDSHALLILLHTRMQQRNQLFQDCAAKSLKKFGW